MERAHNLHTRSNFEQFLTALTFTQPRVVLDGSHDEEALQQFAPPIDGMWCLASLESWSPLLSVEPSVLVYIVSYVCRGQLSPDVDINTYLRPQNKGKMMAQNKIEHTTVRSRGKSYLNEEKKMLGSDSMNQQPIFHPAPDDEQQQQAAARSSNNKQQQQQLQQHQYSSLRRQHSMHIYAPVRRKGFSGI